MPRVNFSKGMTNLTMITADEEVGIALTILILAQSKKGQDIFNNRIVNLIDQNEKSDVDESSKSTTNDNDMEQSTLPDFICIFEILLSFHSWYKSTSPFFMIVSILDWILLPIKNSSKN
jgi:hypothetical protein